jgi:hypothetical protein
MIAQEGLGLLWSVCPHADAWRFGMSYFAGWTMVYVKSILVGLGAAVLSLVLLAAAAIVIGMREQPVGVGAVVGVSGSTVLIVGTIMFAVGFAWMFCRSSRK